MGSSSWKLWMLLDSGLPTGGFAHSYGLESALTHGLLKGKESADFECYLREAIVQVCYQQGPLMLGAMGKGGCAWVKSDCLADATITCKVANRSSRCLGEALLRVCTEAFPELREELLPCRKRVAQETAYGHHAPIFGRVCALLGIESSCALEAFLFTTTRDVISAATRLSVMGPLQAARVLAEAGEWIQELASKFVTSSHPPQSISPLLEIVQGVHDRQYSRLFNS